MKDYVIMAYKLQKEYFALVNRSVVSRRLNEMGIFCRNKETVEKE